MTDVMTDWYVSRAIFSKSAIFTALGLLILGGGVGENGNGGFYVCWVDGDARDLFAFFFSGGFVRRIPTGEITNNIPPPPYFFRSTTGCLSK